MQEENTNAAATTPTSETKTPAQSFAELRRIAEAGRSENEQLRQELAQLKEKVNKVPEPAHDDDDFGSEPYIDSKTFKKTLGKEREIIKKELKEEVRQEMQQALEEEKKKQYLQKNSDFYEIMQADTLDKFVKEYPETAAELQELPDNFSRQKVVYRSIKNLKGLESKQPPQQAPKSPLQAAIEARKPQMAYQPGNMAAGPFASIGDFSQGGMKNAYERFKALQKTVNV